MESVVGWGSNAGRWRLSTILLPFGGTQVLDGNIVPSDDVSLNPGPQQRAHDRRQAAVPCRFLFGLARQGGVYSDFYLFIFANWRCAGWCFSRHSPSLPGIDKCSHIGYNVHTMYP